MTAPSSAAAPDPGREYAIKLGPSMSAPGGNANGSSYFACHAAHMPEASASAGALLRTDDSLSLRVPTTDTGDTGVKLTGTRRQPTTNAMSEYVFEFRDGVVYVHRLADSFANIRPQPGEVEVAPPSPRTPTPLGPAKAITKNRSPPRVRVAMKSVGAKSVGTKTVPRNPPVSADDSGSSSDSSGSDSGSGSGSDSDSGESSDNDSVSYTSRSSDGE